MHKRGKGLYTICSNAESSLMIHLGVVLLQPRYLLSAHQNHTSVLIYHTGADAVTKYLLLDLYFGLALLSKQASKASKAYCSLAA